MVDSLWKKIVSGKRVFIIAEAGVNHNGQLALAKKLVDVAAAAGADAVKFQTFEADRLVTPNVRKARRQKKAIGNKESQWAMLKKLELSKKNHAILKKYCRRKKILFLSTPFDEKSADFLNKLGVPLFKIPSGEITNWPYLIHIAKFKKPMIISTGMANIDEVCQAVAVIKKAGNNRLALLHCVSNYPAQAEQVNLKAMDTMAKKLTLPVGYSDHTLGIDIALAATARGAKIIEKHFTLDRTLSGPDHRSSLDVPELKALVQGIRLIEKALGNGVKRPHRSETHTAAVARKSLVTLCSVASGQVLTAKMLTLKRPGTGIPFQQIDRVVGRRARRTIAPNTLISLRDLQ